MSNGRKFSGDFKLKVALAAISESKSLAELCQQFNVHSSLITKWKRQVKEQGAIIFSAGEKAKADKATQEAEISELHAKIGQLLMERDFLKKKLVD
jgi:transposase